MYPTIVSAIYAGHLIIIMWNIDAVDYLMRRVKDRRFIKLRILSISLF
tara:strand:+ start:377 stop:520 length:144 start_codon:yes stop_codon:yes gene_type:complete